MLLSFVLLLCAVMLFILLCYIAGICVVVVQDGDVHNVVGVLGSCVVVQGVTVSRQCRI